MSYYSITAFFLYLYLWILFWVFLSPYKSMCRFLCPLMLLKDLNLCTWRNWQLCGQTGQLGWRLVSDAHLKCFIESKNTMTSQKIISWDEWTLCIKSVKKQWTGIKWQCKVAGMSACMCHRDKDVKSACGVQQEKAKGWEGEVMEERRPGGGETGHLCNWEQKGQFDLLLSLLHSAHYKLSLNLF